MYKPGKCAVEACPISHACVGGRHKLEQIVIASDHAEGCRPTHLSPEQVLCNEEHLSHIALDFLHDKGWGGEDARIQ